jgi:hypothetical protein
LASFSADQTPSIRLHAKTGWWQFLSASRLASPEGRESVPAKNLFEFRRFHGHNSSSLWIAILKVKTRRPVFT